MLCRRFAQSVGLRMGLGFRRTRVTEKEWVAILSDTEAMTINFSALSRR